EEVVMVLIDYSRKLWKGSSTSLADLPHVLETIDDIEQLDDFYENLKAECAEFDVKPKRRKVMIFIDDYDAFTDESSRKKMAFFENLSALIRKYQTAGVNLIVAGSLGIMSSSDDLRKVYAAPNFGIALKTADAVNRLNGKFPRSLADADLPMGRAFIVRSGITSMLQIATPYANDEDTEGSLDAWVRRIVERYPKARAQWAGQAGGEAKPKKKGKKDDEAAAPAGPVAPDVSKYDIASIKQKLIETGLPEDMVAMFSDADLVENARSMGLLDEPQADAQ
ncbi:MAG: hypothetical protein WHV44_12060, partial [Anaerolineales bacterium]